MHRFIFLILLFPFVLTAETPDRALLHAAVKGNVQEVKRLLDNGAKVNARNALTGWTALTAAAYYGQAEVVQVLIGAGADPNTRDNNGGTPLMKAVTLGPSEDSTASFSRKVEIVKALLKAGADPAAKDGFGVRVWQMPIVDELDEITQVFEDAGVKGVKEERFIDALERGKIEKARALLRPGLDVNARNDDGVSVWSEVVTAGDQELVDFALAAGADVNADFGKGLTPLMIVAARGNIHQVRQFIDKGANISARNSQNKTAIDLAGESRHPEIVAFLKSALQSQH